MSEDEQNPAAAPSEGESEDEMDEGFEAAMPTAKVRSLKKLLAGDARRSVERDQDDSKKPN